MQKQGKIYYYVPVVLSTLGASLIPSCISCINIKAELLPVIHRVTISYLVPYTTLDVDTPPA